MIKVLFVCLGNICRSPSAEGVFRHKVNLAGLSDSIQTDSCGTASYHTGDPPDHRSAEAAQLRGVDISDLRARQIRSDDFARFDYVVAMDNENLRKLIDVCPFELEDRLSLFLEFALDQDVREVPDPYYGGEGGFETVLDLIDQASDGLLEHIRQHHLS